VVVMQSSTADGSAAGFWGVMAFAVMRIHSLLARPKPWPKTAPARRRKRRRPCFDTELAPWFG
jgi:hypothetical protein